MGARWTPEIGVIVHVAICIVLTHQHPVLIPVAQQYVPMFVGNCGHQDVLIFVMPSSVRAESGSLAGFAAGSRCNSSLFPLVSRRPVAAPWARFFALYDSRKRIS